MLHTGLAAAAGCQNAPMTDIHAAAQIGFGTEAQSYAKGRPEYPADLLGWLAKDLGLGSGAAALDLGAGTGKFTRLLRQTGAQVFAVEPVEAMRQQLARAMPDVQLHSGTAQAIPLPDASVDAVLCAQAFHWFATAQALREIHRVLRPGGKLGLVWNVRDESVDWVAAITAIITPYEGDAPRFYKGDWRTPFADAAAAALFGPLARSDFSYEHAGPAEEVIIDRFLSVSFIAALPPDDKARVSDQLHALIASHPALRGQPRIAFPYQTQAYYCTRRTLD
jgi:SAM-dependent methyltransferase